MAFLSSVYVFLRLEELPQYRRDLLQKMKAFRAEIQLLQPDVGFINK